MGVHVVWNTIRNPEKRGAVQRAVVEALAERARAEHWDVKLTESEAVPGWTAVVVAPDKTKFAWYFHGVDEDDTPERVRVRIDALLAAVGL